MYPTLNNIFSRGFIVVSSIRSLLVLVFALFAPINMYIIGDAIGFGIQGIFFRYQKTYLGDNFVTIFRDAEYVTEGIITGKTAISYGVWILGALILVAALILLLISSVEGGSDCQARFAGIGVILAAVLFLVSCCIQYGITLHGPAGMTFPFGIPLLIYIGYLLFKDGQEEPQTLEDLVSPEA